MSLKIIFPTLIIAVILAIYLGLIALAKPIFNAGSDDAIHIDPNKPRILLTCLANGLGGAEIHMLVFDKMLRENGYKTSFLVPANSMLDHHLKLHQIPHYTTYVGKLISIRPLFYLLLGWCLQTLCKKENITIIQCNDRTEATAALAVKKLLSTPVVLTRHVPDPFSIEKIKGVDVIVAVSPYIMPYLESENRTKHLNSTIWYIPPFFDANKFLNYTVLESKHDFFKNNFGISINAYPIITMMANLYPDLSHKNHPLLLQAIKILIHQKNKSVQVMLAGDGPRREYLEKLAKDLGIGQYVHFLGFTDKTPGLLYNSDVFVLSSSKEASPLVYREAGIMKKSAIGATGTGAEAIILNEKTGLLFKNNDAQDLANQIERLIDNPKWAQELGNNAYEHIMNTFSPKATFAKYEKIYQELQAPDQQ